MIRWYAYVLVIYLTITMSLGTASVCLTVFVLNLHHMRGSVRAPGWVRSLLLGNLSRVLLLPQVQTDARKLAHTPNKRPCTHSNSDA